MGHDGDDVVAHAHGALFGAQVLLDSRDFDGATLKLVGGIELLYQLHGLAPRQRMSCFHTANEWRGRSRPALR